MTCVHLKQLYQICERSQIKLSATDIVRIVCRECGVQEVCPSVLMEEYDAMHAEKDADNDTSEAD